MILWKLSLFWEVSARNQFNENAVFVSVTSLESATKNL